MPDDPVLEEMNPVLKLWMFQNWVEDQNDEVETVKNHAYLIGSFINPEAVRKLVGEGTTQHLSSEKEFEESLKLVMKDRENQEVAPGRKRKRRIKN